MIISASESKKEKFNLFKKEMKGLLEKYFRTELQDYTIALAAQDK
jgi:type VI protein secretion system component Hcp